MPKVKILNEVSEGIYRLQTKKADGNIIKIGKKQPRMIFNVFENSKKRTVLDLAEDFIETGKYEKNVSGVESITFQDKTFWGKLFSLPLWNTFQLYRLHYGHSATVPFSKIKTVPMDASLYEKMAEDDTIHELLKPENKLDSQLIMILILGAVAGFFAGVVFGPELLGALA